MTYTSFYFLLFFLPLTLFVYWVGISSCTKQNLVLLIASLVFYGFYGWKYLIFLLFSIGVTYSGGRIGWKLTAEKHNLKGKWVYLAVVVLNLGMLIVFKYSSFLTGNLNQILMRWK